MKLTYLSLALLFGTACAVGVTEEPESQQAPEASLAPSLLAAVSLAFPMDGEEASVDARFGSWREAGGSRALLLEDGRAGWFEDGEPKFFRVTFTKTNGIFESWGQITNFELSLDGEQLHVVGEGKDLRMNRLERTPEELRLAPYELAETVEVTEDLVKALSEDLLRRRSEDQRVRTGETPDWTEMQRVDADNTEFLRNIIFEMGWIDATRFGAAASDAAFLVVQHTRDLRLMVTALPFIEKDVRAGRLDGQNYALLFDCSQLNLGYTQRYGSQLSSRDGAHLLMACEDITRVDEFRAEMGMGPLSNYLAYFVKEGDPPIQHIGVGEYRE